MPSVHAIDEPIVQASIVGGYSASDAHSAFDGGVVLIDLNAVSSQSGCSPSQSRSPATEKNALPAPPSTPMHGPIGSPIGASLDHRAILHAVADRIERDLQLDDFDAGSFTEPLGR